MTMNSLNRISRQPKTFTVLVMNMTRPLGIESASAPTTKARTTYDTVKKNLSSGVSHGGPSSSTSMEIAARKRALSASEEKNCAAMMV
jgi:hypothetical protein